MNAVQEVKNKPSLSIIIPAYSEEMRIGKTLDELSSFLKQDKYLNNKYIEVLVVAANSLDSTDKIVKSKTKLFEQLTLLQPGARVGKGRDVQYGMLRASGKYVLFMDADLATPLHHIVEFYKECTQGYDVVVGTRDLSKHHPNFFRRSISIIGNILFRITGGVWIEDSQCGFKMFSMKANEICFRRLTILSWGFDMEILTIAKTHELKIKSIRINDWSEKSYSTFNENIIRVSVRSLGELSKIVINKLRGCYR